MRRHFMILTGLVAVLTLWGTGAASAATPWTVQATPNPSGALTAGFNDVSCASATNCIAVGGYDSGNGQALAEHWNGRTWAIQVIPDPSGAENTGFHGVSCTSAASCMAVGMYNTSDSDGNLPLAEHWNGHTWKIQNPSGPTGAVLLGVSCTSATSCTAVGYVDSASSESPLLAEHWNGRTWSVQATPDPSGADVEYPDLTGVSCASATSCIAIGSYFDSSISGSLPVTEHWNGHTWSLLTTPIPSGSTDTELLGVSCASARSCTATGYSTVVNSSSGTSDVLTLAEHWNGSTWSIQATPNPSGATSNQLEGISCTSATTCTAAGSYSTGEPPGPSLTLAVQR